MSDTDDDFMPNNIEFVNSNTGMGEHAPSIHSNLTSGVYNNNEIASMYNMPNNYLSFGQPSIYTRRETSAMSIRSLPVSRMQSQNSYYQSQGNSQGSVYRERCRSPMSMRSIGSNASVTVDNILFNLKHSSLNKCELRRIKDACQILMGGRSRRKIGKRRHLKSILKFYDRKSGGASSVEGSDSSRSSDDCRSTRSTYYKDNVPLRRTRPLLADCNKCTTKTSLNDIYEDRSENLKHNSLRNLLIPNNKTGTHRSMHYDRQRYLKHDRYNNNHQNKTHSDKYSDINENRPHINFLEKSNNGSETDRSIINPQHIVNDKIQNESAVTLKDRFTESSFLLPSQRFRPFPLAHSTSNEVSFNEKSKKKQRKASDSNKSNDINGENSITNKQTEATEQKRTRFESDSEDYEIFSQNTRIVNTMHSKRLNHKRIIESEDMTSPERKRNKLNLSSKLRNQTESLKVMKLNNKDKDDSNFKKPQLPVRKNNFFKGSLNTASEILIAKSSQPLVGVVSRETVPQISTTLEKTHNKQETTKPSQTTINTLNDISMTDTIQNSSTMSKPSYIKRKLFTQNLDIVDSNNLSDPLYGNSPQPKTLRACREKNKVRKLVTSQPCLSRDVNGENNVIDLIHKIVPPDQINVTSALNKQDALNISHEDEDRWDVMSIISRSNIDDASDTYSDQEIFDPQEGNKENKNGHRNNTKEAGKVKFGITKDNNRTKQTKESDLTKNKQTREVSVIHRVADIEMQKQTKPKKVCPIKSFWDTDLSDVDDGNTPLKMKSQEGQKPKKVRLVKSFSDTDSEVENHGETVKRTVQEEQTGRHNLRNTTTLSIYNNRIHNHQQNNTKTKKIVNSTINSNTKGRKITESENISKITTRSRSKSKEEEQIQNSRNSKLEAKRMIREKTPKTIVKPSSSKEKKKEESSNNLNSSRQSRRIQKRKSKNNASNLILDKSTDLVDKSNNCNRSRESVRLKQKRERSMRKK